MLAFVPPFVGELSAPALIVLVLHRHRRPSVSADGLYLFWDAIAFQP